MIKATGIGLFLLLTASLWGGQAAYAETIEVRAEDGALLTAVKLAKDGDTLTLAKGVHRGPVVIDKSLTILGEQGAIIDAGGVGSVVHIKAPDVTLHGLRIIGSGSDHEAADSAVFLDKTADRARIENNVLIGNLIGVYVWGQRDALVARNIIEGRQGHRMNERGNGVYVWNAPGATISYNDIRYGRDGIFVNASKKNRFIGNRMRDLRFAVHYMYTHSSEVSENVSIRNHAGYALMFSDRLTVKSNYAEDSKLHGILLNYANRSKFSGNKVLRGGERCVFIYNSNRNTFSKNWFEACDVGIHFTGGSEQNSVAGNAFLSNRQQVKYVGTKWVEWSEAGKGNYWSDNAAFDMDQNGLADTAYKPNDLMDQIIWRHPMAKSLLQSPAVGVLKWAQGQFPALYPGGVIDSQPLMRPTAPNLPTLWQENKNSSNGAQK